jgi:hypothetical protein
MRIQLLIALTALGVAGCGSASSQRVAERSNVQTVQQTDGASQSASNQSNSGGNGNSTTQSSNGTSSTTQSSTSGSVSQSTSSAGGATLNTFTGTGDASIRITLGAGSRLLWSNTHGDRFTLRSDDGAVSIDSSAGSGEAQLPAGTHQLHVSGRLWTVLVRPS